MSEKFEDDDIYTILGASVELISASKYHQQFPFFLCVSFHIMPAIRHQQIKIYSKDEKPIAMVIWAWLTDKVLEEICHPKDRRPMMLKEWNCGSLLYFSDLIAPYGNGRKIFFDLVHNVFPEENKAISVRRNMDGTIRKRNTWQRK